MENNTEDRINESLNNENISNFVSPNSFVNLDFEMQEKIIDSIQDNKRQERGFIGKFLGTKPINIAMNIAFVICVILLLFVGVDIVRACIANDSLNMELLETVIPVITLVLGYIFGKGFNNKN